jgi:hypothetical protein
MGQTVKNILTAFGWKIQKTAEARKEMCGELGNIERIIPAKFELSKEFPSVDAGDIADRIWDGSEGKPVTLDLGDGLKPYTVDLCTIEPAGAQTKLVWVKVREAPDTTHESFNPLPSPPPVLGEGTADPTPAHGDGKEVDTELKEEADAMNEISIDSPELGRAN